MGSPLFNLINEQLAKEGLYMVSMMGNVLEPEYIWSTEAAPIRSIDDISGKKIRVVSFEATKIVEGYGAAAVRIPSSELYLGLQRNTVDAAVANISTVVGRSLQEQIHQVYRLPLTGFGIGLFVTTRRWDALDGDAKAAFESAAAWFDENGAAYSNNTIYKDEYWPLIEEQGIEVLTPSAEELARLDEAAKPVREAWVNDIGKDIGERAIALAMGEAG